MLGTDKRSPFPLKIFTCTSMIFSCSESVRKITKETIAFESSYEIDVLNSHPATLYASNDTALKVSVFGVILVWICRIWIEYGEILRISPYSVRIWENANQNNSEYRHFSRSVMCVITRTFLYQSAQVHTSTSAFGTGGYFYVFRKCVHETK